MTKILANDGIDAGGKERLEAAGIAVETNSIPQEELASKLNDFDGILVRSATKVRQDLIDACPNLKFIGRGGVGMDNIDVAYARENGRVVENTPAASSHSVAELVFAHLLTGARFLHDANREMPVNGSTDFKNLKKKYAKGIELKGKTIGIIGFGRIGQSVAKIALGMGLKVLAHDRSAMQVDVQLDIAEQTFNVPINILGLEEVLSGSDFITVHTPFGAGDKPLIDSKAFEKMKDGAFVIQCGRGGAVDESALLANLNSGKIAFAGLDVFENEPTPNQELLKHPNVSATPHIGGSTNEAQGRIGIEIADKIIQYFK